MSTLKVEVVEIDEIEKHPNADRLDLVRVKGWHVVAGRVDPDQPRYKAGDRCIYIPIDSVLEKELEDHLFPPDSKITLHKSRVRTIKIRKAISQGMIMNLDEPTLQKYPRLRSVNVGDDVASIIGVTKYEPPVSSTPGLMRVKNTRSGNNPNFAKYTDIENYKYYPDAFAEGERVYITEKLHGTSARFGKLEAVPNTWWQKLLSFLRILPKHEFVYGSRNVQLQNRIFKKIYYGTDVYAKIAKQLDLENVLQPGEVLYGEIVGDGIQKGYTYGCGPEEHKFYAYDLKINGQYVPPLEFLAWCTKRKIDTVPVLRLGTPLDKARLNELRGGDSSIGGQKVREGVVVKPMVESHGAMIGRKVLKFINDEYLLRDQTDFH